VLACGAAKAVTAARGGETGSSTDLVGSRSTGSATCTSRTSKQPDPEVRCAGPVRVAVGTPRRRRQLGEGRRAVPDPLQRRRRARSAVCGGTGDNRLQEFTFSGRFVARLGRNGGDGPSGSAPGQFSTPYGVGRAPADGGVRSTLCDHGPHHRARGGKHPDHDCAPVARPWRWAGAPADCSAADGAAGACPRQPGVGDRHRAGERLWRSRTCGDPPAAARRQRARSRFPVRRTGLASGQEPSTAGLRPTYRPRGFAARTKKSWN
jgi:hypothetical protein